MNSVTCFHTLFVNLHVIFYRSTQRKKNHLNQKNTWEEKHLADLTRLNSDIRNKVSEAQIILRHL